MDNARPLANPQRKLFFGLFVFPLLIAVGMAVLLCSVVLLTHESQTPESLITAIKTGPASKRWQKAFELSNELNRGPQEIRSEGIRNEIAHILLDTIHYDERTRSYMAIALSHFQAPESLKALHHALNDPSDDVKLYTLWAIGSLNSKESVDQVVPFLHHERPELRKIAAYILGVIGNPRTILPLKVLLDDPVADVRWNSALSLARLGDDSGWKVLVKMLERQELSQRYELPDDEIEKVMINAAKGLALISKPDTLPILEPLSRSDKSLKVRQAAIEAIQYLKNHSVRTP